MAKGYWIAHMQVKDAKTYEDYKRANAAPLARHGGRFLVRAGAQEVKEGRAEDRTVVIEFPSVKAARACYDDPDYRKAIEIRQAAADGTLLIIEGYD